MSKRKSITTNSSPVKVKFFKSSFEEYSEKEKQKILAEFGNIPSAEIDKELKRRWDKLNVVEERENGESGQQLKLRGSARKQQGRSEIQFK